MDLHRLGEYQRLQSQQLPDSGKAESTILADGHHEQQDSFVELRLQRTRSSRCVLVRLR